MVLALCPSEYSCLPHRFYTNYIVTTVLPEIKGRLRVARVSSYFRHTLGNVKFRVLRRVSALQNADHFLFIQPKY